MEYIQTSKVNLSGNYTPTKLEVLQRQNEALEQTIKELREKGLSDVREKTEYKLAKNIMQIVNSLGLTLDEKTFIKKQTCFLDEKENENHKVLDVNCLVWALLNVRENLIALFGEVLADKFFELSLNLDKDKLERNIKKVIK